VGQDQSAPAGNPDLVLQDGGENDGFAGPGGKRGQRFPLALRPLTEHSIPGFLLVIP
jgi:hypothetical protein